MSYDYTKAKKLEDKARILLNHHRTHMFYDFESDWTQSCHRRAIIRLKALMMPYWNSIADEHKSERMLRIYD